MRIKTALIAGIAALLIVGAIFWLTRSPALTVATAEVERGDVIATVANTRAGTVDACRRARLSPAMGDRIARLPVSEGDAVKANQILLELWNDDLRAEQLLAERDEKATKAKAEEACVRARTASRESARLSRLKERGLASDDEADRALGNADALMASCAAARDAIEVSAARVDVATARLERSIMRAPFDGVIAEINGELGEFITPSPVGIPTPPTVDLIDPSCLYITAPIDEVDAPAVRAGQQAVITMDAFPEKKFSGKVRRVAPYVLDLEKQARTVEIEAVIDDPESEKLLPGYSADVEIILQVREDVLRVPRQALVDGARVFVLQSGTLRERTVKTGVSNWEFVEVLDGLQAGDRVVLSVDREGVEDGAAATSD